MALDRHQRDASFGVIPVRLPGSEAPLNLLSLHTWVEISTYDEAELDILAAAIRGEPPSAAARRASDEARATICPYVGLASFREEDALFFFGRETVSDDLEAGLVGHRMLALVGSSGTGKSSILQAGLLPRLRRRTGQDALTIIVTQPKSEPFVELARHLVSLRHPELGLEDALPMRRKLAAFFAKERAGLADFLAEIHRERGGHLLIAVDQWEELYTSVDDPTERARFLEALFCAMDRTGLAVVITLRADYTGYAFDDGMHKRLHGGIVGVGPMERADLRRAIEEPAHRLGRSFQPGLVERILDDVGADSGVLPLLQFLLEGLWNASPGQPMTHQAYEALGGVRGAIAKRAEIVFQGLTEDDRRAARDLLVALVRPGEGTLDSRRFVSVATLSSASRTIVHRLSAARLLVAGEQHVEVTHEALIREWQRLKGWVDEDREFLQMRDRIEPEAVRWSAEGRGSEDLLIQPGRRLEDARALLRQRPTLLKGEPVIQAFIMGSIAHADRKAALTRKRQRQALAGAMAAAVVLALTTAGTFYFLKQSLSSEARMREAYNEAFVMGDGFVTKSANEMRQVAGMPADRVTDLLRRGEEYFSDMANRAGGTPESMRSLARMQLSFAGVSQALGDDVGLQTRTQEARNRLLKLDTEGKGTPDDLQTLAETFDTEAEQRQREGNFADAVAAASSALAYRNRAAALGLEHVTAEVGMAWSMHILSRATSRTNNTKEGESIAHACLDRLNALSADAQAMTKVRNGIALCQWALGYALGNQQRPEEAEKINRQGLQIATELVAKDPTNRAFQRLEFVFLLNLGAEINGGKSYASRDFYRRAVAAARARLELDHADITAQVDLALGLHNLGSSEEAGDHKPLALAAYEEAYGLRQRLSASHPKNSEWETSVELTLSNIVRLLKDSGDTVKQRRYAEDYLALEERLAAQRGMDSWRPAEAFDALFWTAEAARQDGIRAAAFARYLKVIDRAEPFRLKPDADRLYRNDLSFAVSNLRYAARRTQGDTQLRLLEQAEAIQARYVAIDPRHWMWAATLSMTRLDLAKLYLADGQRQKALATALLAAESTDAQESAELLTNWFQTGSGAAPVDPSRAAYWMNEARNRPNGMKRFTVPSLLRGGDKTKVPWHVYIQNYYKDSDPAEAMIYLAETYDGVILPDDVKDSFRKLLVIAKENKVSFTDLCVYALAKELRPDAVALDVEKSLVWNKGKEALTAIRGATAKGLSLAEIVKVTLGKSRIEATVGEDWSGAPNARFMNQPVALLAGFGAWLESTGEPALAVELYDAILPGNKLSGLGRALVLRYRAAALERLGRLDDAMKDLSEVITIQPSNAVALEQLGSLWADQDMHVDWAEDLLKRALTVEPSSAKNQDTLGWVYTKQGRLDQAFEQFAKAEASEPASARLQAHMGEANRRAGHPEEARQRWQRALALQPDDHLKQWIEEQLRISSIK